MTSSQSARERGLGPLGRFLVRRRPLTAVLLVTGASILASSAATQLFAAGLALELPWQAHLVSVLVPAVVAPLATTSHVLLMHRFLEERERVKQLAGMLPMCAWCKKIRDDAGYWQQVERYLAQRGGTVVTHGLCPECYARMDVEDAARRP